MEQHVEDFFYGKRGARVDAKDVMAMVGNDPVKYRGALVVARGNNVRITN